LLKFFSAQIAIEENFRQKPRSDYFAGINGNNCDTAVSMLEEMMAAFNSNHFKSRTPQGCDGFPSRHPRKTGHDATLMV
jgi:hypothetical protein